MIDFLPLALSLTDVGYGVVAFFVLAGTAFGLLAAVGILRMPDVFCRMHASTKAASLGVGCSLIASGLFFGELGVWAKALLTLTFVFITAPVAAHLLGRAAYLLRTPKWEKTVIDEAEERLKN